MFIATVLMKVMAAALCSVTSCDVLGEEPHAGLHTACHVSVNYPDAGLNHHLLTLSSMIFLVGKILTGTLES